MTKSKLLLGAILCGGIMLTSCGTKDTWSNIDLIAVKLDGSDSWSMMDDDGDIYYEDEFKNEPTASYNGYFSVKEGKGYTVYKSGSKKPQKVGKLEELVSVGAMEKGLIPVTFRGKRITVVDDDGKQQFELKPVNGDEIESCDVKFCDGLLWFRTSEGKFGFYNTDGKVAIKPTYDAASAFNDGITIVGTRDDDGEMRWKAIDTDGKEQFKLKSGWYPEGGSDGIRRYAFKDGYMLVSDEDRYALVNKKGELKKLPAKVERVRDYNSDYVIFYNGDGWGVLDIDDEDVVIKNKYNDMEFCGSDKFLVKKDKEWMILNHKGEKKETFDFSDMGYFHDFGFFASDGGKVYTLVKDNGKQKGKAEIRKGNCEIAPSSSVTSDYNNSSDYDYYDDDDY